MNYNNFCWWRSCVDNNESATSGSAVKWSTLKQGMPVFILELEWTGIGDDLDEEDSEKKGRTTFGYCVPFDSMHIFPLLLKLFFSL